MHMIASVVGHGVHRAIKENRQPNPVGYARRPSELPGDARGDDVDGVPVQSSPIDASAEI